MITHTAGLPPSTCISHEMNLSDTKPTSANAVSIPSSDMTPPPTLTSATDAPRKGSEVISASSSAVGRRLIAPLTWRNLLHLRRFIPLVDENVDETQQNRHLLPSLGAISTATTTQEHGDEDGHITARLMSTASSNAAVRRQAWHFVGSTHLTVMGKSATTLPLETYERRQVPSQSPSPLASGKS